MRRCCARWPTPAVPPSARSNIASRSTASTAGWCVVRWPAGCRRPTPCTWTGWTRRCRPTRWPALRRWPMPGGCRSRWPGRSGSRARRSSTPSCSPVAWPGCWPGAAWPCTSSHRCWTSTRPGARSPRWRAWWRPRTSSWPPTRRWVSTWSRRRWRSTANTASPCRWTGRCWTTASTGSATAAVPCGRGATTAASGWWWSGRSTAPAKARTAWTTTRAWPGMRGTCSRWARWRRAGRPSSSSRPTACPISAAAAMTTCGWPPASARTG